MESYSKLKIFCLLHYLVYTLRNRSHMMLKYYNDIGYIFKNSTFPTGNDVCDNLIPNKLPAK